ncbi:threonine/serine exporter family protein [Zhihengliuella flava]|uniref:Uncharacterized membrane protein YjjP (DUF1212 family) n=1 Tax=Zhihengliuella flava TaxID=1285193 RepID=A0A931D7R7_9MICC|nr:uncharacterized membrane protein YjjP (DUF1212 family) [Zhihengliuella flava]
MSRGYSLEPEQTGELPREDDGESVCDKGPQTDANPVAEALPRVTTGQIDNPLVPTPPPVHTGPAVPGVDPYTKPVDHVTASDYQSPHEEAVQPRSQAEVEFDALNYGHGVTATEGPDVTADAVTGALDHIAPQADARPQPAPPTAPLRQQGQRPPSKRPQGKAKPRPKRRPRRGPETAPTTPLHPATPELPMDPPSSSIRLRLGKPARPSSWAPSPGAKKVFSRMMMAEHPPTQAFSIVDRLVGSPYANPTIQVGMQESDARETLEFTLDLAETMFRFGGGALEAETSIIAVTASFGLRDVDVDITNQSIHINYAGADQTPISLLRVVRSWTSNYAGLALVHQLVTDIVAGDVSRREAVERLAEINRRPKPFPRWVADMCGGVFAGAFVMFIGGSWLGALIAIVSWMGVTQVLKLSAQWRIPEFFATMFSAVLITTVALVLWRFHVPIEPGIVIAGGIMLLLPSARFVASAQDAINGFPVTAIGRLLPAMMIFAAIITGIMTGIVIGEYSGIGTIDVTQISQIDYPWWVLAATVAVAITAGSVFEQTSVKLLLPTTGVALLGFATMLGVENAGVGARLAPALAAVVIGAAGRLVALRLEAPQMVVAVPAMMFLLPGLMIFRAMYGITVDEVDMSYGLAQVFNALGIILAIAGGIVLGDTIARPLTKGWNTHERRRIRRR